MNRLLSPRSTAWFAAALGVLGVVPLVRLAVMLATQPAQAVDRFAGTSLAIFTLSSVLSLGTGAWRILRRDDAVAGLKWVMGGSLLSFASAVGPASWLGLAVGALAWWQSSRLPRPAAQVRSVGGAPFIDTPAMRRLFWITLSMAVVVLAAVGAYVKIMLDRAGKPTLSWSRGAGYSMILILPFAAGFAALAFGARHLLRKRLAASPEWVAQFGVPCWIGALAGAVAGGVYGAWPMMMDVEASIIAVLMPWWFAQWQAAGAAVGGAAVYLVLTLLGRGRGPR
jgi:hypothetical protein